MSSDPAPDELDRLWNELAAVATETARLLIQPNHNSAEVEALDLRAEALRKRIKEVNVQQRAPEPVELHRPFRW